MDQGNNFTIPGRAGNLVGSGLQQPPIRADPVAAVPPRESLSINSAADALLAVAHGGREQATGGRGRPGRFNSEGSPVVASRTRRMSRLGCFGDTGCSRPIGIGNWELLPTGEWFLAGWDFTPHLIMVNAGENFTIYQYLQDITTRIGSFVERASRGICILSASGSVSNVEILQTGTSDGILTYEGRFEIVSLSGSFLVTDSGMGRSRSGGLSVSVARSDGQILGGKLAGALIAASPVQIMVGSFMPEASRIPRRRNRRGHAPAASATPRGIGSTSAAAPPRPPQPNNPGHNLFSTPMQEGHQLDNTTGDNEAVGNASVNISGWNNPMEQAPPVQRTPPPIITGDNEATRSASVNIIGWNNPMEQAPVQRVPPPNISGNNEARRSASVNMARWNNPVEQAPVQRAPPPNISSDDEAMWSASINISGRNNPTDQLPPVQRAPQPNISGNNEDMGSVSVIIVWWNNPMEQTPPPNISDDNEAMRRASVNMAGWDDPAEQAPFQRTPNR